MKLKPVDLDCRLCAARGEQRGSGCTCAGLAREGCYTLDPVCPCMAGNPRSHAARRPDTLFGDFLLARRHTLFRNFLLARRPEMQVPFRLSQQGGLWLRSRNCAPAERLPGAWQPLGRGRAPSPEPRRQ